MGFGYNPELINSGERLDIINFFSWMKQLQQSYGYEISIFDASGYYIVNKLSDKTVLTLGPKPNASQVLDAVISEQDRPKRAEIITNCNLRSKYLKRAIDITGVKAKYIDSRIVFREDKDYNTSLDEALEFFWRLQVDDLALILKIIPANTGLGSKFYLPMEIAEATYLQKKFSIDGKFGPSTEEFFDESIMRLTEESKKPYQFIRCPTGPRRPAYLRDREVILTSSSDSYISSLLQSDTEYREFVEQYTAPFKMLSEPLESVVSRLKKALKLDEA